MIEACRVGSTILDARKRGDREPMMLVIVSHESEHLVLEHNLGLQYSLVPIDHLLELVGAQNRMREFGGNDFLRCAIARIAAHDASPQKCGDFSCDHRSMLATRQSLELVVLVGVGWGQ